jgi:hypothetical protein
LLRTTAIFAAVDTRGFSAFFAAAVNGTSSPPGRSIPGSSTGFASRQCTSGGIGNTSRSSRIAPLFVCAGYQ